MRAIFFRFLSGLLTIAIILGAIGAFYFTSSYGEGHYIAVFPFLLLFFVFFTLLSHTFLVRTHQKNPKLFTNMFLTLMGLKLLLFLVFVGVYLYLSPRETYFPFVISFMIMYIVFTIYEIRGLIYIIQKAKKNQH